MTARRTGAAALALAALALTGCAFGPDPEVADAEARAVFDDVAAALSDTDPALLRTVETAPQTQQECGEDGQGSQTARVATGTLSVTARPAAIDDTVATIADLLDPDEWDRIHRADDAPGQRAWASANGVVVAVTFDDPVLVAAVFTPCLR